MTKLFRIFVTSMITFMLLSCSNLSSSGQGKISVQLPGEPKTARKIVETQYTKEDAKLYKVSLICVELDFQDTKEGEAGDTIIFDALEPGKYIINVQAFNDENLVVANAKAPVEVLVVAGETQTPVIQMIPLKYKYDDGETKPEIKDPEIDDPVIDDPVIDDPVKEETIVSEINVFLKKDFLKYEEAKEFIEAQVSGRAGLLKSAFDVFLISEDNNELAFLSLEDLDCISVSMPFYTLESTGESVPYVGEVPFTFNCTASDEGIKVVDPETNQSVKYSVKKDLKIEDLNVTIKYPVTPKVEMDEENIIKLPSLFGSDEIEVSRPEAFYETPKTYFYYSAEGKAPETVCDEISEVEVAYDSTDYLQIYEEQGEDSSFIYIDVHPYLNENFETEIKQTVTVMPSDWAYFEEEDLSCTKTTTIEVVPYTISEVLDANDKPVTTFETDTVYHVVLENEADKELSNFITLWEAPKAEESKIFVRCDGENGFFFMITQLTGETYDIMCSVYPPRNEEAILDIKKEITLSVSEEANISKLSARLKVTEKNKEYVFVSDEESYALCTGSNNENNGKTGQILTPDDFEFYTTDANGREKIFEIDNSNNGYRVEIANNNWGAIGRNIPVTITRSWPVEENFTTVTLKRYSKEATVSLIDGSDSKYSFIVNATDGYPVYSEKENDITRNIDYITLDIELLNTENKVEKTISIVSDKNSEFLNKESNSLEENNTAFNKLDVLIDFAALGLTPGDYILNVTSQTFITDYEGLFLPSTVSEIKISVPEKNDDGSNTEDKIQTTN
ncbi:MAG: hypothetical protein MJ181_04545 [Treponema sp.]|nr:hypothetical protein [Treponema sp.]